MCFFDKNVSIEPQFYNYPTTTCLTHYGSCRTVQPFDPPMQNTIYILYKAEKPSVQIVTLPSQPCLHRLKPDLLEMKAESSGMTKFVLKSLNVRLVIHTSAQRHWCKPKQPLKCVTLGAVGSTFDF